jgi:hypothetical protein
VPTSTLHRKPGINEAELPGELILVDLGTRKMFSLNQTSTAIWRALDGCTDAELASYVATSFDVARNQAETDVRALVANLEEAGLVVRS